MSPVPPPSPLAGAPFFETFFNLPLPSTGELSPRSEATRIPRAHNLDRVA